MQGNHANRTFARPPALLVGSATALLVVTTALPALTGNEAQAEILRGTSGDFEVQTQEGLPGRGQTQTSVRKHHGQPNLRHPTVGDPPITRWDYDDFSVVFEGEHVLHSIVHSDQTPRRP